MDNQEAMQELNKLFAREFGHLMPRSPSYRFYRDRETGDRYFYTTEKINHGKGKKYVAGIYRYLKTKKQLKLVRRVGFAKKYKAKNAAWVMYQKATTQAVAP